MPRLLKRFARLALVFLLPIVLAIACSSQPNTTSSPSSSPGASPSASKPLIVGVPPWPGFGGQYVANDLGFFKEAGIEVKEVFFPVQSDSNAALLAGKVDLILTGVPDLLTMASRDPSLKLIALCDYSDGSDGILGRNIKTPADVKGKTVARENLLIEILLLRRYLEKGGLTEKDIKILDLPAADSATAFAAGKVDVAVTWEPFLSKAAKEGNGEIIFTTKGTNIIPDGLVTRSQTIQERKTELLAYLRAFDKAVQLIKARDQKAVDIIAKRLSIKPEEALPQLDGVRFFDTQDNKTVAFDPKNPMNIFDSLQFAAQTAQEMKLTPTLVDAKTIYDDSLIKGL